MQALTDAVESLLLTRLRGGDVETARRLRALAVAAGVAAPRTEPSVRTAYEQWKATRGPAGEPDPQP